MELRLCVCGGVRGGCGGAEYNGKDHYDKASLDP